jgi:hypothetical protein
MIQVNFDNFKCRCSAISNLLSESRSNPTLTEKQATRMVELLYREELTPKMQIELAELQVRKENAKNIVLSDTCIVYLMQWYAWETAQKKAVDKEAMYIQFVEKGKDVEADSIELLSKVNGVKYEKNEQRICNEYLSGIPDIYVGEEIMLATKISDIKSAWDYPGYLKKINTPVQKNNDLQIKGYMDITGATEGEVCDCLVNTPLRIVKDIHDSLLRKMPVISEESPEFQYEWSILERSMFFDDIPYKQRVFKKSVEPFNEFDRQKLYDRVKVCRDWLWTFNEMFQKLNN